MSLLQDLPLKGINSISISKNRIIFSSARPRRKPREGDVKTVRGKVYVRQQVLTGDGYLVCRGRPVFEWVSEDKARSDYRTGWVQAPRKRRKP